MTNDSRFSSVNDKLKHIGHRTKAATIVPLPKSRIGPSMRAASLLFEPTPAARDRAARDLLRNDIGGTVLQAAHQISVIHLFTCS